MALISSGLRSRSKSKEQFSQVRFDTYMNDMDITHYGVAGDETYLAYKDIDAVMEAQKELVAPIAIMEPKVVVMGGKTQSDDGD